MNTVFEEGQTVKHLEHKFEGEVIQVDGGNVHINITKGVHPFNRHRTIYIASRIMLELVEVDKEIDEENEAVEFINNLFVEMVKSIGDAEAEAVAKKEAEKEAEKETSVTPVIEVEADGSTIKFYNYEDFERFTKAMQP